MKISHKKQIDLQTLIESIFNLQQKKREEEAKSIGKCNNFPSHSVLVFFFSAPYAEVVKLISSFICPILFRKL
jgi:hypothetical protein